MPPEFQLLLRAHLLPHTAPSADGLLFPGDRTDQMSARFLRDRLKTAREVAGLPELSFTGRGARRSCSPVSTVPPSPNSKPASATPHRRRWPSTSTVPSTATGSWPNDS